MCALVGMHLGYIYAFCQILHLGITLEQYLYQLPCRVVDFYALYFGSGFYYQIILYRAEDLQSVFCLYLCGGEAWIITIITIYSVIIF